METPKPSPVTVPAVPATNPVLLASDAFRARLTAYPRAGQASLLRMALVEMSEVEKATKTEQKLILATGDDIQTLPGELWLRVGSIGRGAAYQTKGGGHRIVLAKASQYDGQMHDVTESGKALGLFMPKMGGQPMLAISVGGLFITTAPGTVEEAAACKASPIPTAGVKAKGDVELG